MATGPTYEAIATVSPTSGTDYTFSNIPSTYTDLVLIGSCKMSGSTTLRLRLNGATSNYTYQIMRSDGTFTGSSSTSSIELCDNDGSYLSTFVTNIMNYSAATLPNKVVVGQGGDQTDSTLVAGSLNSSSSISSVTVLTTNSASFTSESMLTLYGIARA